jgi:hypothetical protein
VLQVCGSLLLMDVWAIAQTECDVCVVRWAEAVLSGPTGLSVQGRRSDVVAVLPAGPGLSGGRR